MKFLLNAIGLTVGVCLVLYLIFLGLIGFLKVAALFLVMTNDVKFILSMIYGIFIISLLASMLFM